MSSDVNNANRNKNCWKIIMMVQKKFKKTSKGKGEGNLLPMSPRESSHSSFYTTLTALLPLKMCLVLLPCAQDSISTHASDHAAPQLPRKFTASANMYLRFPRWHKHLARGMRRRTRLIEHEHNIRRARYFPRYLWPDTPSLAQPMMK